MSKEYNITPNPSDADLDFAKQVAVKVAEYMFRRYGIECDVFLFGSRATGEAEADSDFDICAFLHEPPELAPNYTQKNLSEKLTAEMNGGHIDVKCVIMQQGQYCPPNMALIKLT